MLRDRYFYPLAALIIVGMIWFAMSLSHVEKKSDIDIRKDGYTLEGEALIRLTASPGTNYEYVAAAGNDLAHVRLWTHVDKDDAGASAGVFGALNSDYERAFADSRLRMTLTARQSRSNPLDEFEMGYFTAGAGDSGWKPMTLTSDWAEYSFVFKPKLPTGDPGLDYFGIWPGSSAEELKMDISKMRIEVLPKPAN